MKRFAYACLGFVSLVLVLPLAAPAEPRFDGFIEAEARDKEIIFHNFRIVGGVPFGCVPRVTFENLTTGFYEPLLFECCDEHFNADGVFSILWLGFAGMSSSRMMATWTSSG